MKSTLFTILSMIMLIMMACTSREAKFDKQDVEKYTKKIENRVTLTQDDYKAMTDIMADAYSQLIPDTKEILMLGAQAATGDKEAEAELEKKSAAIEKKYSDLNLIMEALGTATPEQMGKETYERFHKLVSDGQKQVEDYTRELISSGIALPASQS